VTVTPTTWTVDRVVKVVDGDTLRVERSRLQQIGDNWYRLTEVHPDGRPRSVLIRLAWVDTPERGTLGWAQARDDLTTWLEIRTGDPLRVVCYESAGWDRILADLVDDDDGASASQWLMAERHWPPYIGGAA
jgi:endonuclease YncB( thermonuclease family)